METKKEFLADLQENHLHLQEQNGGVFAYAMVDRELAQRMLNTSDGNRTISKKCVSKYAKHMENGTWETDTPTQFIMFDENGTLINGHHTLLAVIRSGVTVKLYFMFNVARSPHIDCGRMRSEADRYAMMYGVDHYSHKRSVAVCNVLNEYTNTRLETDDDRFEFIRMNEDHFNMISRMTQHVGTGLSTAPVYTAIFLAAHNGAAHGALIHFWEVLQSGFSESGGNDQSIIRLRDWLKAQGARKSKAYRQNTLNTVSDVLTKWLNGVNVRSIPAKTEVLTVYNT